MPINLYYTGMPVFIIIEFPYYTNIFQFGIQENRYYMVLIRFLFVHVRHNNLCRYLTLFLLPSVPSRNTPYVLNKSWYAPSGMPFRAVNN